MAPEQAKGSRDLDHRVDLYAAGVILYEAVTGEVPFNADTFNELLFKIVLEAAKPVEHVVPSIDPNFAAIVNKSMARDPAHRFQTAREFQQALEQWATGAGPQFAAALNASAQAPGVAPAYHQPAPTGPYAAVGTGQHAAIGTGQHAAVPAHSLGTGTPGNWANTGGYAPPVAIPKKSSAGLFIGLAVVGVLLLGGGAVVAMSLSHSKTDAAAAAGKLETEKLAAEKAKAAEAEKAEKAAQEASAKAAGEAEKAKAEALKSETEKAKAEAAAAAKGAKVAAVAPAPRAAKPAPVAAKPEPKPEPKPAAPAPTAAPASTGRRIRTTL
jgi:serine/threonine-protein kinase